jgi:integrase
MPFHRDSDGAFNESRPLIPGLRVIGQPNKGGFTGALKVTVGIHGIELGFEDGPMKKVSPHDFRKSLNTALATLGARLTPASRG